MAKTFLNLLLIILVTVMVGCNKPDSGQGQLITPGVNESRTLEMIKVPSAAEADLVEQLEINRQAYRQGLTSLSDYYLQTGNNMKHLWANKELESFDAMPRYNYIIAASLASPNLKAVSKISEADDLYYDTVALEDKARALLIFKDDDKLRVVLDKYNELIRKYPSSDKIDDAAFRAGKIYEHFKDYTIAVLYYQRAFQWNPDTPYQARYRAAVLLDEKLHQWAMALDCYNKALEAGLLNQSQVEYVTERVAQITRNETLNTTE